MTITLTPEIENAIIERAQQEGTTAERLALDSLRHVFVAPRPTPEAILALAAQVYAGLSDKDKEEVEQIALNRTHFFSNKAAH